MRVGAPRSVKEWKKKKQQEEKKKDLNAENKAKAWKRLRALESDERQTGEQSATQRRMKVRLRMKHASETARKKVLHWKRRRREVAFAGFLFCVCFLWGCAFWEICKETLERKSGMCRGEKERKQDDRESERWRQWRERQNNFQKNENCGEKERLLRKFQQSGRRWKLKRKKMKKRRAEATRQGKEVEWMKSLGDKGLIPSAGLLIGMMTMSKMESGESWMTPDKMDDADRMLWKAERWIACGLIIFCLVRVWKTSRQWNKFMKAYNGNIRVVNANLGKKGIVHFKRTISKLDPDVLIATEPGNLGARPNVRGYTLIRHKNITLALKESTVQLLEHTDGLCIWRKERGDERGNMFPRRFSKFFVAAVFVLGAVAISGQEYDGDGDVDVNVNVDVDGSGSGSGQTIIEVRPKFFSEA